MDSTDRLENDQIGRTAATTHYHLVIYAVIAHMLSNLDPLSGQGEPASILDAFPFLAEYRSALAVQEPVDLAPDERPDWWDARLAHWEHEARENLPLRRLADVIGLSAFEVRLLVAAGLVEEDIRFGALFAGLQEPLQARRPCIGLLGWLVGAPSEDAWPACRSLLDLGVLVADNRAEPRSEWVLRVPPPLWDAIRGQPVHRPAIGLQHQPASDFPALDDLILPGDLHSQVARLPALLVSGQVQALVLRGMRGTGRRTLLGSLAGVLGRDVLLWDEGTPGDDTWRLIGPLATLTGAMPVLRCDPGPGAMLDLPALFAYGSPVGIAMGRSGGLQGPLVEQALTVTLSPPDALARRRFWQVAMGINGKAKQIARVAIAADTLTEIGERFLLTGGVIHRAAAIASTYAALAGRESLTEVDVRQASQALNRQALETLATHLPAAAHWADLVVGPVTVRELDALERRCRNREHLQARAGRAFDGSLNRGVRALFSGPSGTGKTLAARALAASLEMDLYRVDLAAVVNKYIGETERNLNQVLSRAEELDVVLLLDEGDALMAQRTDVRNSNDRYANLETNYLLQRLEVYEGIVIVTTNALQRIDPAFLRRLDVVVDFLPPEVAERWLIWQSHLPEDHAISAAYLEEVASRCALTGGQIRNAALHATLLASDNGPVADQHLAESIQREYRKAGAAYPMRPAHGNGSQVGRLRRLAAELR